MTSNQSAEPHGTYLVLGLLIAAGAMMFLWLAPRNQDTDPETEASEAAARDFAPSTAAERRPAAAPAAKATAPAPRPEVPKVDKQAPPGAAAEPPQAADPPHTDLFAQPMPDFMQRIYKRVGNNQWLSAHDQKLLYDYGQEHKDDARPQLMLAWDARNRDWDGIAARMYRIAFTADERAKDDPSMLPDLISIASRHDHENVEYKDSSKLIADAYGAKALPDIEDEISLAERRGEQGRLARLNRLRDALRDH